MRHNSQKDKNSYLQENFYYGLYKYIQKCQGKFLGTFVVYGRLQFICEL